MGLRLLTSAVLVEPQPGQNRPSGQRRPQNHRPAATAVQEKSSPTPTGGIAHSVGMVDMDDANDTETNDRSGIDVKSDNGIRSGRR